MAGRSSHSRTRSRARIWLKRLFLTVLVLANLVVFGAYGLLRYVAAKVESEVTRDQDVVAVLSQQPTQGQDPRTFLVIGSDSRENLTEEQLATFGRFAGGRADVIMLVKVFPDEGRAQMLSLPRDLRVEIPGHGTNKINAAFAFGGASLMVETVKRATGLEVHHYVEVDFVGFAAIVDQLGGVEISFPFPARDLKSGLQVDAGVQRLNGMTALAYARSRSYQELRGGSWVAVDASDIGRTRRQQQLVFAILSELKRPAVLAEVGPVIEAFGSHLTVDGALSERTMIDLAWAMRSIGSEDIEAVTLPTVSRLIGGASYQLPDEPAASAVLAAFAAGGSLAAAGGPIRIDVLNGNAIAGSAGRMAERLTAAGFEVREVGDADAKDFAQTQLIARPADLARAHAIADLLGFGEVRGGSVPSAVDVVVIVGRDAERTG